MDPATATLTVGVFATALAAYGIWTQRSIAKAKATLDFIVNSERDEDMISARTKFVELAKADEGMQKWAAEANAKSDETQKIVTVLNEFELVEIGIKANILDKEIYAKFNRGTVISYWTAAEPFVKKVRERNGNAPIFVNFEKLAQRMEQTKPQA